VQCEAAAAILASEGPAPVSVGRQHARISFVPQCIDLFILFCWCVCCFVLLTGVCCFVLLLLNR